MNNTESSRQPDDAKLSINIYKSLLHVCFFSIIVTILAIILKKNQFIGPFAILTTVSLALFVRSRPFLSVTSFSLWMIAAVTAPMFYPSFFFFMGKFSTQCNSNSAHSVHYVRNGNNS